MGWLALAVILSYLAGSIPVALMVGRAVGGVDIRKHGSGNAGATNVYRLYGLKPYLFTLSIDIFKGFAAVAFISKLGAGAMTDQRVALLCGVAAIIGHIWTVFAGFRGGKGVATAAGVILGLMPIVALVALGVYLVITFSTGYVSLGSMFAAISAPISMYFLTTDAPPEYFAIVIALAGLIIFTHRVNIQRLLKGEESKTNFLKRKPSPMSSNDDNG
jgi:glycerol-3-phosphate acyltransferase PlsY